MQQPLVTEQPSRRAFLQAASATAALAGLALAGCGTDTPEPTVPTDLSLGSIEADTGLLNYVYLLKQVQAAFYQKVFDALPADLQAGDEAVLRDLRDHEVVHRQSLRYALGNRALVDGNGALLTFDFSKLTLNTRAGVLAAARTFEDLSVAALYNVLQLLTLTASLNLLVKIASVEARHAAAVRDLLALGSFADDDAVVASGTLAGAAVVRTPADVVAALAPYFTGGITINTSLLPLA